MLRLHDISKITCIDGNALLDQVRVLHGANRTWCGTPTHTAPSRARQTSDTTYCISAHTTCSTSTCWEVPKISNICVS